LGNAVRRTVADRLERKADGGRPLEDLAGREPGCHAHGPVDGGELPAGPVRQDLAEHLARPHSAAVEVAANAGKRRRRRLADVLVVADAKYVRFLSVADGWSDSAYIPATKVAKGLTVIVR